MNEHPRKAVLEAIVIAVAAGAAATTIVGKAPFAGKVSGVSYIPKTGITGVNTNNRKFELINKGAAGAGATVAASLQHDAGVNSVSFDEKTITLSGTAANLVVAEGDVLAFVSSQVGTGIADDGGRVFVEITKT